MKRVLSREKSSLKAAIEHRAGAGRPPRSEHARGGVPGRFSAPADRRTIEVDGARFVDWSRPGVERSRKVRPQTRRSGAATGRRQFLNLGFLTVAAEPAAGNQGPKPADARAVFIQTDLVAPGGRAEPAAPPGLSEHRRFAAARRLADLDGDRHRRPVRDRCRSPKERYAFQGPHHRRPPWCARTSTGHASVLGNTGSRRSRSAFPAGAAEVRPRIAPAKASAGLFAPTARQPHRLPDSAGVLTFRPAWPDGGCRSRRVDEACRDYRYNPYPGAVAYCAARRSMLFAPDLAGGSEPARAPAPGETRRSPRDEARLGFDEQPEARHGDHRPGLSAPRPGQVAPRLLELGAPHQDGRMARRQGAASPVMAVRRGVPDRESSSLWSAIRLWAAGPRLAEPGAPAGFTGGSRSSVRSRPTSSRPRHANNLTAAKKASRSSRATGNAADPASDLVFRPQTRCSRMSRPLLRRGWRCRQVGTR